MRPGLTPALNIRIEFSLSALSRSCDLRVQAIQKTGCNPNLHAGDASQTCYITTSITVGCMDVLSIVYRLTASLIEIYHFLYLGICQS